MDKSFKKAFLIASVVIPFLAYCVYYYAHMFKNAPYKFTEFESFSIAWGAGDSLVNHYNSKTGAYQYVDSRDSLIRINVHLPKAELLYLHRKAAELGFWDWPAVIMGDTSLRRNGQRPPRYVMEFNYRRKSKKVIFDESYELDRRLVDANKQMIAEIQKVIDDQGGKEERK